MGAQHTPGPWICAGPSFGDPLPRYTTEIVTEWEGDEGDVISICDLPLHHHDDENEANARLIAAAPEMLAALKECVLVMERDLEGLQIIQPELRIARAAVAKATGENL